MKSLEDIEAEADAIASAPVQTNYTHVERQLAGLISDLAGQLDDALTELDDLRGELGGSEAD